MSTELTRALAQGLRIPFAVGGGVSTIEAASELFASGADKVIVGRAARTNPELLRELVDVFGSQSIVASVDSLSPTRRLDRCELQFRGREVGIQTSIQFLQDQGVGEIILTNCELDGTMAGIDIEGIRMATDVAKVPLVVGSGVSGINCFSRSFDEGASGVFAGALFQFTSSTPDTIRAELRDAGYHVRQKIT